MRRIRVNNKQQLKDALETIILKKLENAEREHAREMEQAEKEKQLGKQAYYSFMKKLKPVAFEFYPLKTIKLNIPWVCPDAVADWFFYTTNWQLSVNRYVSSPSSLLTRPSVKLVCTKAGAYPIQEGRLNSWFYTSTGWNGFTVAFVFRQQSLTDWQYGYEIGFTVTGDVPRVGFWLDEYWRAGIDNIEFSNDTWLRRQTKFYVSEAGLTVRWEKWSEGNWVQEGNDIIDTENKYYGNQTNYAGLVNNCLYGWMSCYIDDTEIWKAS